MMIECTTDSTSDSMRLTDEEIDKIINSEKSKSLQDPYGFSVVNTLLSKEIFSDMI